MSQSCTRSRIVVLPFFRLYYTIRSFLTQRNQHYFNEREIIFTKKTSCSPTYSNWNALWYFILRIVKGIFFRHKNTIYWYSRRELFVERRLTFVESLQTDLHSLDPFQHECLRLVLIVNSLHELLRKYLQLLVLYHNFRDLKYKIVGRPDVGFHDGYLPPWLRWDQRSMFWVRGCLYPGLETLFSASRVPRLSPQTIVNIGKQLISFCTMLTGSTVVIIHASFKML